MEQSKNTIVLLQNDHIDWITKHPDRFVNNLITRINSEHIDNYPGQARWNGDSMPGVQIIWTGTNEFHHIIDVGNNGATKLTSIYNNNNSMSEIKEKVLKFLAKKLGYELKKIEFKND